MGHIRDLVSWFRRGQWDRFYTVKNCQFFRALVSFNLLIKMVLITYRSPPITVRVDWAKPWVWTCVLNGIFKFQIILHFFLKRANSADPDEILHSEVLHLELHCLRKYLLGFSSLQRGHVICRLRPDIKSHASNGMSYIRDLP